MTTRTAIFWNMGSGSSTQAEGLRKTLADRTDISHFNLEPSLDLTATLKELQARGVETFVAAGGDGTVSAVGGALVASGGGGRLGLLPYGTGNDLARSLNIPLDPAAAWELLEHGRTVPMDVIRCQTAAGKVFHSLNVVTGGLSTKVSVGNKGASKSFWGSFSYLIRAFRAAFAGHRFTFRLKADDGKRLKIRGANIVIANGRYCGGGTEVAPLAKTDDGLLDVIVVKDFTAIDLLRLSARLMTGDHIDDETVYFFRTRTLALKARPGFILSTDGETKERTPMTFACDPKRINVIRG